jgi:hypothetical protein
VAILNIKQARIWLGEKLGRRGPVSGRTMKTLIDQGLPVGLIGESPFLNPAAMELWLEERAGLPLASYPTPTPAPRNVAAPARRRGRPRKHVD